jgi:hypothetical protein
MRVLSLSIIVPLACTASPTPTSPLSDPGASARVYDAGSGPPPCGDSVFTLEGIHELPWAIAFEPGSDSLSPDSMQTIAKLVQSLRPPRPAILKVAALGYANTVEPNPQVLADRRADRVRTALVEGGLAGDRIEAHGLGTTPSKGSRYYDHNRFVVFETLYEYRGPVKRWEAGTFVTCDRRGHGHEPGCEPPAGDLLTCIW